MNFHEDSLFGWFCAFTMTKLTIQSKQIKEFSACDSLLKQPIRESSSSSCWYFVFRWRSRYNGQQPDLTTVLRPYMAGAPGELKACCFSRCQTHHKLLLEEVFKYLIFSLRFYIPILVGLVGVSFFFQDIFVREIEPISAELQTCVEWWKDA